MPVFLKRNKERDCMYVSIGKMDKASFQDTLARVKATPGRRPNPDGPGGKFVWEFPFNADTALRLMTSIQPIADVEIESMVKRHSAEIATQLITALPDDAVSLLYAHRDDLYPFQRACVEYGAVQKEPRLLIADEMGLGKTVESTALVEEWRLRNSGFQGVCDTLVISPKAVRGHWEDDLGTWGDRTTQIVDGRTPEARVKQLRNDEADTFVINWEAFWREPVITELMAHPWEAIIADEVHRAKNRKAKQAKGLFKLHAPIQLALTGTPIMNSPDELWSILHWLFPKAYTSFWAFHNSYVDEYMAGFNRRVMVGVKNADALRFELSDKMVRRTKKDKLPDLPDKMPVQVIEVELTPAQRRLYKETETALFVDVAEHIAKQVHEQFQDTATTFDKTAEAKQAKEAMTEELANMPIAKLAKFIPNAAVRIAKLRQITAAAKVAVADELIREEPDTPVVAFTWHVDAARQLAALLEKGPQGLRVGTIAGNDDADPVKDSFQKGDYDHVVCTIAKGGTGLTLTRSSNPLLVEEDWTPAINDQAIDRTHRIGQEEIVTPRVLRCKDTVDDGRVAPRNVFKRAITAQIIGG